MGEEEIRGDVGLPHDKRGGPDDGLTKKGAASSRPVGGAASRVVTGIAAALAAGVILPNERGTRFYHRALAKKANKKKRRLRKIAAASKRKNRR